MWPESHFPALSPGASSSHTTAECPEPLCQVWVLPSPGCLRKTPERALPLSHRSYGLMRQSIPLHAPMVIPRRHSLCWFLPVPAGEWIFPTLSPQSLRRRLDPYPAILIKCLCPFSSSMTPASRHEKHAWRMKFPLQCNSYRERYFEAAIIHFVSGSYAC